MKLLNKYHNTNSNMQKKVEFQFLTMYDGTKLVYLKMNPPPASMQKEKEPYNLVSYLADGIELSGMHDVLCFL